GLIRVLPKPAWALIILFIPVLGFILWYLFGRGSEGRPVSAARPRGQVAPDDDEDYLRQVDREVQLGKHAPQASDDDEPSSSTDAYAATVRDSGPAAASDGHVRVRAARGRSHRLPQRPAPGHRGALAAADPARAALPRLGRNQRRVLCDRPLS